MKIAISKASGSQDYLHYPRWLLAADDDLEFIDLITFDDAEEAADAAGACSGLLLCGGPDVDPARYGKADEADRCRIDARRDAIEFAALDIALEKKIPVLGVCRGAQLINVALGGTLYTDIPQDTPTDIEHARVDGNDSMHRVVIGSGSLLMKITGATDGEVNSAHHQAIENHGHGLVQTAEASDTFPEALEFSNPAGASFLVGVQWHPERMNHENPLSLNLARHFVFESYSYNLLMG